MRTHFITFGSGHWVNSVKILCEEVKATKLFDEVHGLTENDLGDFEKEFIKNNPRGYGYWIWKSYLCKKITDSAEEGDIFVYADAGCAINTRGLRRMKKYFEILKGSDKGILGFQLTNKYENLIERRFSKKELLTLFGFETNEDILNSPQIQATAFLWKKCPHSQMIINRWNEISQIDKLYINDVITVEQDPVFNEHRHDQSIFSLLLKKHGCELLGWETWCWTISFNRMIDPIQYPILAMRGGKPPKSSI